MPRAKRVDHGDGSVYRRASDGRWIAAIVAGVTARGTMRRITVSAKCPCTGDCLGPGECPGERDALRKLRRKRAEIERDGLPVEGVSQRATVGSWAPVWLAQVRKHLAPKGYAAEAVNVNRWIIPTIGRRKLHDLTPADVRATTQAVTKAGRSTTTARGVQGTLFRMLKAAQLEGHTVPPRVLLVRAPSKAVNDRDAIPRDDALAILAAAQERPDASRWVAALLQGLRQGECLGLTWDAVDLDAGTLTISWQLQPLKHEHGCVPEGAPPVCGRQKGGYCPDKRPIVPDGFEARHLVDRLYLKRPKSKAGWRVQPLVPWMKAALTEWRQVAPENPWGLVWAAERTRGGNATKLLTLPQTPVDDGEAWQALQDVAGVRHSSGRYYLLHEARHTTATLLLEAKIPDNVITAILGHSSIVTSRGYMHTSQTLARDALEAVAGALALDAREAPQLTA